MDFSISGNRMNPNPRDTSRDGLAANDCNLVEVTYLFADPESHEHHQAAQHCGIVSIPLKSVRTKICYALARVRNTLKKLRLLDFQ